MKSGRSLNLPNFRSMWKRKSNWALIILLVMGATTLFIPYPSALLGWKPSIALTGDWIGKNPASLRVRANAHYNFISSSDSIPIHIRIQGDGKVEGQVGQAVFTSCTIRKNRGWIGRRLHVKSDYIIKGTLEGKAWDADITLAKKITIPVNVENGLLRGALFHHDSHMGLYPMTDILLNRAQ